MQATLDFWRRQSWAQIGGSQPLRVFVALASLLALCALNGWATAVIALYLGVIASALAETDDNWRGRVRAQGVTLAFFAAAAWAVQALIDVPWMFALAIAVAAFCLTMMGALQARYKSIGFATLVLAMYATIGIDAQVAVSIARHREPLLLLTGAAWYGLLSIAASAALPAQAVQHRLATLFEVLGTYMSYKASLFEPLRGMDIKRKRLSLAQLNAGVVHELNAAKESIVRRLGACEPTGRLARYRELYLIAQDVHERANSSHDDYNALADAFFHSDLLYRCQRVLMLQGDACSQLAQSIAQRVPFVMDTDTLQALDELRNAVDHQRGQPATPQRRSLLASVEALTDNLAQLQAQLAGASETSARMGRTDMGLVDTSPHSLREMATRVRQQLVPGSMLFRHASRLAIALSVGHAVMYWIHPAQGYWILLTTLFVCQQSYGETVARLSQRTAGTVLGVVVGWALLQLFPQSSVQALLAVGAGVLFFSTRVARYVVATAAITVLVLLCSNQVGHGAVLIVPRLIDTLIGSLIAWLAVALVFPRWQSLRFNELAAASLRGQADYLSRVTQQYRDGARDDLPYRIDRRSAHDADAALSTAVVDMHREPGRMRPHAGLALRFLIQSHTLLNYISALGAHRVALPDSTARSTFVAESGSAANALHDLAQELDGRSILQAPGDYAGPAPQVPHAGIEDHLEGDPSPQLFSTELILIRTQIESLQKLARDWLKHERIAARQPHADEATMTT